MTDFTVKIVAEGTPHIVVFHLAGHPPFICGVNGAITTRELSEIEELLAAEDVAQQELINGDGDYLFGMIRQPGQYDSQGRCEMPAHWEFDLVDYRPVPQHDSAPEPK